MSRMEIQRQKKKAFLIGKASSAHVSEASSDGISESDKIAAICEALGIENQVVYFSLGTLHHLLKKVPSRGLIFVVMIMDAYDLGIFKGFSLQEDGANLSLLQYADDALFFGLAINLTKSILNGIGVHELEVASVAVAINCKPESLPFMYLEKKGISWVKWESTFARQHHGGLGIGSIKAKNSSLLGKWWWGFLNEEDALWCRVVKAIHGPKCDFSIQVGEAPFALGRNHSWNNWIPRKVNVAVWRAANNRLAATMSCLSCCGMVVSSSLCPFYECDQESIEHTLCECPLVRIICLKCWAWWNVSPPHVLKIKDVIFRSMIPLDCKGVEKALQGVLYTLMWSIWNWRNKFVHGHSDLKSSARLQDIFPHVDTKVRKNLTTRRKGSSEYSILKALHPELPGPEDRIVDFPEGKVGVYTKFFEFANFRLPLSQFLFDILGYYQIHLSQLFVIGTAKGGCLSAEAWEKYPTMLYQALRFPQKLEQPLLLDIDLFRLIRAPNPTKVKTGSRPRAAHEVPLLTVTANRVIEMEDLATATDSSGEATVPEAPPPENITTTGVAPEAGQAERVAATSPPVVKERRKRGHDRVDTNAPPKVLRRDHADPRPTESAHVDVSDPDPLSFADPQSRPSADVTQSSKGAAATEDPDLENTSFASMVGYRESIYRPEWGITNGCLLDVPEACQDLVDHIAPPGYFSELRHLHNDDFLKQYNVNLARQVAMGSQLRLKFEQEAKLLKKSVTQAEADMKNTVEDKSAELSAELENMRALFSDLQVSNNRLSQQLSTLQEQVIREEKLKAAFEEFKQYKDNQVEQRCAEIDARLDVLSIDFNEELYSHMLTAITGHRWMIGRGLRLAVMKCGESTELRQAFADVVSAGIAKGMSEGLKHIVEHGKAKLDLEAIEAYDPKAEAKYIAALHALKNLKYPLVDQLESLKDAPMDVIMASLHLESDTGDDAPQWIRELRPSSSQLTIPVYPEVRDPMDPWACKEEILLADAIAANISRAEKKKTCRVGLAILLADAPTQTKTSDEASPRLLRSSSLPVIHG
nr:RNA-directed DNA polymerase, eukaryota, reverse transcriptase zinc-binding domain protein [Tanacetum cinerariifolium]